MLSRSSRKTFVDHPEGLLGADFVEISVMDYGIAVLTILVRLREEKDGGVMRTCEKQTIGIKFTRGLPSLQPAVTVHGHTYLHYIIYWFLFGMNIGLLAQLVRAWC